MGLQGKCVKDSLTVQTNLLMPADMNAAGTLFGGRILSWIDMLAGIVAMRHTDSKVVTAALDHMDFQYPAYTSDVLTLVGKVTWTGNTSLEIKVEAFRENKGGVKELTNTAYLVMVAVDDETGKPIPVPPLLVETEEEKAEWEAGVKRAVLRKQRRKENF